MKYNFGRDSQRSSPPTVPATMRAGLTLIELLVVIAILGMITMATIPLLNPQAQPRRVRESSRLVGTFFGLARSKAISEARPVGVVLERQAGNFSACMRMSLAEAPPPYAGDDLSARVEITGSSAKFTGVNPDLIKSGDTLQVNYQGHLYTLGGTAPNFTISSKTTSTPRKTPTGGSLFQVFRQPMRSNQKPVQLPNGIVIDLGVSGIGATQASFSGTNNIIIMFGPTGAIETIYDGNNAYRPQDAIHLLVGWNEKVLNGKDNLKDPGNIWVTIGHQTGLVSSIENQEADTIAKAREWAANRLVMGGK